MATIPQINYGIPAMDYGPLTQSLANLGQGVGMALAMKAQQKQAAEALPALQESYKNAFGKISRGEIADGYSDLLSASMNPAVAQNPFLSQYASQADQLARSAANAVIQQGFQRGGGGGGGGGGGTTTPSQGIPAMTPKEAAEKVLLNKNMAPDAGMEGNLPPNFNEETDVTEVAQGEEPSSERLTEYLTGVASSAGTREFKEGIRASLNNIPPAKDLQDIRNFVERYKSLTQDQQKNEREKVTQFFDSRIDISDAFPRGSGYTEVDGAENILGKGYTGFVLKEAVEPKGYTAGTRGGSAAFGTNKEQIEATAKLIIGNVKELNRGDVGKFFKDNGGISNVELVETERGERVLRNKQNPDIFIPIEDMKNVDAISTAFGSLETIFPSIDRLSSNGATASLIAIRTPTAEGPSRSAVPTRTSQPTNLLDLFPPQR